jgi:hypothetical protein
LQGSLLLFYRYMIDFFKQTVIIYHDQVLPQEIKANTLHFII